MKKVFLYCLLFGICTRAFSQINLISPEETSVIFKQTFQYNFLPDHKNNSTGLSTRAILDMNELRLDLGLSETGEKINVTFRGIYWPSFNSKKINFGAGFLYHVYVYPYEFTENDFKLGLYFKIKFAQKFTFFMDVNYFAKVSVFNLDFPSLLNQTVNLDLIFSMQTNSTLMIYGGMLTNTFYDYPLSFEPSFILGVEKFFTQNFMLGAELNIDFIDFIIAVGNVHQVNFKVNVGYKI